MHTTTTTLLTLLHSFAVAEAAYHSIPLVKSRVPTTYPGVKIRQTGQAPASETEVHVATHPPLIPSRIKRSNDNR